MRQRVFSSGFRVWFAILAVFLATPALAQPSPSAPHLLTAQPAVSIVVSTGAVDVGDLLRQGRQLEAERRWSDALTHYEDAMRRYPGEASLQQRRDFARVHYDLQRRYADRSFCEAVAQLPPGDALDLYDQVLLKIQAHYVESPDWKELVERGTNNFEVALGEPAFLKRNLPEQIRPAIESCRRELHRALGPRVILSRRDARDAVARAAQLAQQRLQVAPTAVVLEYLCGATNTLDPYSAYLTPNQLAEVYSQIEGNFIGLGIELKMIDGKLSIVRVISGSPAEQSGLRAGDQILSVDGRPMANLSTDQAADLLQGQVDSVVRLAVARPPQGPREVSIRRRRVDVPSVDRVAILDRRAGIGYFRLACFQKTTCDDVDAALWKLHRLGMKSLIIDLRGNPGGLLVTAVKVVDRFVDRGVIVSTRGRSPQEDFTYSAHTGGTWTVPLVVLIDEDSASAAEIFAGAIRDHRRGTIVGTRSYGKGSVQGIFPLSSSTAGLRLTTARFYSPTGHPYSRIGVEPHVLVHRAARPIAGAVALTAAEEDTVLAAAVRTARAVRSPR